MKKILCAVALAAALMTSACNIAPPATPSTVANKTVLDEQIAVTAELAYKAARLAAETAVDAGLIRGTRADVVRVANVRAKSATDAVRNAYAAGNALNYSLAAAEAERAVNGILAAIKGE